MTTIMDPNFFHGHDFVRVLAPGPVHLPVRPLPDLFDSFVVPNSPCHVGPLSQTHTTGNRNNRRATNSFVVVITIVAGRILVLHWHMLVRIGAVWGKRLLAVDVRRRVVVLLLLWLSSALVLVIWTRGRIPIVRGFPSILGSTSHRCHTFVIV